jgi:hypothetical protein
MMDVLLWALLLWQSVEPIDVHPGWWFGALCAGIIGLFGFLTKIWVEDRKDRRAEKEETKAERVENRKAIDDLSKFHREHLVGMLKENQTVMIHVAEALTDCVKSTNDLTQEVRADRMERRADREQRQSGGSGVHGQQGPRRTDI